MFVANKCPAIDSQNDALQKTSANGDEAGDEAANGHPESAYHHPSHPLAGPC